LPCIMTFDGRSTARTCHAVASRLAVASCEGWLVKADPYEFAMYYDV